MDGAPLHEAQPQRRSGLTREWSSGPGSSGSSASRNVVNVLVDRDTVGVSWEEGSPGLGKRPAEEVGPAMGSSVDSPPELDTSPQHQRARFAGVGPRSFRHGGTEEAPDRTSTEAPDRSPNPVPSSRFSASDVSTPRNRLRRAMHQVRLSAAVERHHIESSQERARRQGVRLLCSSVSREMLRRVVAAYHAWKRRSVHSAAADDGVGSPESAEDPALADIHAALVGTNSDGYPVLRPTVWTHWGVVAFMDLSGFTRLAESLAKKRRENLFGGQTNADEAAGAGGEELIHVLNVYFGAAIAVIHHFGGDVVKFAGDAMLVWWPVHHGATAKPLHRAEEKDDDGGAQGEEAKSQSDSESSPSRMGDLPDDPAARDAMRDATTAAVRAGVYVLRAMKAVSRAAARQQLPGMQIKVGVAAGRISAFLVGGMRHRFEFFISGDPVEESGEMADISGTTHVVLAESAKRLLNSGHEQASPRAQEVGPAETEAKGGAVPRRRSRPIHRGTSGVYRVDIKGLITASTGSGRGTVDDVHALVKLFAEADRRLAAELDSAVADTELRLFLERSLLGFQPLAVAPRLLEGLSTPNTGAADESMPTALMDGGAESAALEHLQHHGHGHEEPAPAQRPFQPAVMWGMLTLIARARLQRRGRVQPERDEAGSPPRDALPSSSEGGNTGTASATVSSHPDEFVPVAGDSGGEVEGEDEGGEEQPATPAQRRWSSLKRAYAPDFAQQLQMDASTRIGRDLIPALGNEVARSSAPGLSLGREGNTGASDGRPPPAERWPRRRGSQGTALRRGAAVHPAAEGSGQPAGLDESPVPASPSTDAPAAAAGEAAAASLEPAEACAEADAEAEAEAQIEADARAAEAAAVKAEVQERPEARGAVAGEAGGTSVSRHSADAAGQGGSGIYSKALKQQQGPSWLAESRRLTVIFVMLPNLPCTPESAERVQRAVAAVQRSVYAYDGTLRQHMVDDKGQVAVCAFGLAGRAQAATRALCAAQATLVRLRRLNVPACIGVATGTCFCGLVGSRTRNEYTLAGDIVNLAARLMGASHLLGAGQGTVLCCGRTRLSARRQVFCELVATAPLKGKSGKVAMFRPAGLVAGEVSAVQTTVGAVGSEMGNGGRRPSSPMPLPAGDDQARMVARSAVGMQLRATGSTAERSVASGQEGSDTIQSSLASQETGQRFSNVLAEGHASGSGQASSTVHEVGEVGSEVDDDANAKGGAKSVTGEGEGESGGDDSSDSELVLPPGVVAFGEGPLLSGAALDGVGAAAPGASFASSASGSKASGAGSRYQSFGSAAGSAPDSGSGSGSSSGSLLPGFATTPTSRGRKRHSVLAGASVIGAGLSAANAGLALRARALVTRSMNRFGPHAQTLMKVAAAACVAHNRVRFGLLYDAFPVKAHKAQLRPTIRRLVHEKLLRLWQEDMNPLGPQNAEAGLDVPYLTVQASDGDLADNGIASARRLTSVAQEWASAASIAKDGGMGPAAGAVAAGNTGGSNGPFSSFVGSGMEVGSLALVRADRLLGDDPSTTSTLARGAWFCAQRLAPFHSIDVLSMGLGHSRAVGLAETLEDMASMGDSNPLQQHGRIPAGVSDSPTQLRALGTALQEAGRMEMEDWIAFRHKQAAKVVYSMALPAQREEAHYALADHLERRALHVVRTQEALHRAAVALQPVATMVARLSARGGRRAKASFVPATVEPVPCEDLFPSPDGMGGRWGGMSRHQLVLRVFGLSNAQRSADVDGMLESVTPMATIERVATESEVVPASSGAVDLSALLQRHVRGAEKAESKARRNGRAPTPTDSVWRVACGLSSAEDVETLAHHWGALMKSVPGATQRAALLMEAAGERMLRVGQAAAAEAVLRKAAVLCHKGMSMEETAWTPAHVVAARRGHAGRSNSKATTIATGMRATLAVATDPSFSAPDSARADALPSALRVALGRAAMASAPLLQEDRDACATPTAAASTHTGSDERRASRDSLRSSTMVDAGCAGSTHSSQTSVGEAVLPDPVSLALRSGLSVSCICCTSCARLASFPLFRAGTGDSGAAAGSGRPSSEGSGVPSGEETYPLPAKGVTLPDTEADAAPLGNATALQVPTPSFAARRAASVRILRARALAREARMEEAGAMLRTALQFYGQLPAAEECIRMRRRVHVVLRVAGPVQDECQQLVAAGVCEAWWTRRGADGRFERRLASFPARTTGWRPWKGVEVEVEDPHVAAELVTLYSLLWRAKARERFDGFGAAVSTNNSEKGSCCHLV